MPSSSSAADSKHAKKLKKRRVHHEEQDEDDASMELASASITETIQSLYHAGAPEEDKLPTADEERQQDQAEREAFEERLRSRDASRTLHKAGGPSSEPKVDREHHLVDENTDGTATKEDQLSRLREISRQEYLKKREEKQLELLEFQLKDEEYLFQDTERTDSEKKQFELNQQIFTTARARQKKEIKQGYHIPDSYDEVDDEGNRVERNKEQLLTDRYDHVEDEHFKTEQERWEEHQVRMSTVSKTRKSNSAATGEPQEDYELVFEDQIDFISQQMMTGKHVSEEDIAQAREKMERAKTLSMQETRAQLPIFGYRESLLEAVRDYQILIIVGETGSGKTTQVRFICIYLVI